MLDIPDGPLAAKVDRLRECDPREQALQIIMGGSIKEGFDKMKDDMER